VCVVFLRSYLYHFFSLARLCVCLYFGSCKGHTAIAELLIARGADVNAPTGSCRLKEEEEKNESSSIQGKEEDDEEEARSPLMLAVIGRMHALLPILLTAGADPLWVSEKRRIFEYSDMHCDSFDALGRERKLLVGAKRCSQQRFSAETAQLRNVMGGLVSFFVRRRAREKPQCHTNMGRMFDVWSLKYMCLLRALSLSLSLSLCAIIRPPPSPAPMLFISLANSRIPLQ